MRYWCLTVVLVAVMLFGGSCVRAQPIELACDRNTCDPAALETLFAPSIRWYPGMRQVRTIRVLNTDTALPIRISAHIDHPPDVSAACQIDRHMYLAITSQERHQTSTLRQWGTQGVYEVGVVSPGERHEFAVAATMDAALSDVCQGASTQMDVRLRIDANGRIVNQAAASAQKGSVLGAFTQPATSAPSCKSCYWWPLYALQIVLYGLSSLLLRRPAMRRILALGPIAAGIPIGAQLLYLIINSGCLTSWHGIVYVASANPFCALMLMWSIALYLAFLTLWGLLIYDPRR